MNTIQSILLCMIISLATVIPAFCIEHHVRTKRSKKIAWMKGSGAFQFIVEALSLQQNHDALQREQEIRVRVCGEEIVAVVGYGEVFVTAVTAEAERAIKDTLHYLSTRDEAWSQYLDLKINFV